MTPRAACLAIAGSDSGGGAGIQADLKTFGALGVYGACAITALTVQDTHGVHAVHAAPASFVARQVEVVLQDLAIGAIKIGMLATAEIARAVAGVLAHRTCPPIVLDPVMLAQSGDPLLDDDAVRVIAQELGPLARLITPNWPEAERLAGRVETDPRALARAVSAATGARAVLLKGGHRDGPEVLDLLLDGERFYEVRHPRREAFRGHGTGCTLSSAIAAFLARGCELAVATERGIAYLQGAIAAAYPVGHGAVPVHHFWASWDV